MTLVFPKSWKNCLVISALCWLNSKVYKCPSLPSDYDIAHDRDPDPVPASITLDPGMMFSLKIIAELSIA